MTEKGKVCLWFNHDAEDAAAFYARTFPDTRVTKIWHSPSDYPDGRQGDVIIVEFEVMGISCVGLNGGDAFKHSEAFSFYILTADQAETDRYWNAIVDNGGAESNCGWCKDKWGISWQIVPKVLDEGMTDPDRAAAKRVMEAMMTMNKIDVARIEAARKGVLA
jgi:predicted 3-demethylubiquinone-9 3-methyltransferase (glyoxalase superfamily)